MIDDEIRQVFMDWLLVSDSRDTESLRYAARQHILALEAEVARLRSALGSISCSNPCEDSTVKALRERKDKRMDVKGLDKAVILAALYNRSRPQ